MFVILFLIASGIVMLFGFVLLFGAPYVPTLKAQQQAALELLDLKPDQTLLELGCGDGRVLKAAAQQGLKAVGYELNPILVCVAKLTTWKYRHLVSVKWGDFWTANWPPAEGIFVFLLDKYMEKLDTKITQSYSKKVKVASYAFEIPGRTPTAKKAGVYLYAYAQKR